MSLEVGSVVARFETRFESAGVDRFEARITQAERKAKDAGVAASTAGGGFRRFGEDAALAGRELETAGGRASRGAGMFRRAGTEAGVAGEGMRKAGGHAKGLALSFLGFGGAIGLEVAIRRSSQRFGELQRTTAQTEAALKSTRGQAHITAKEIDELAKSIGRKTGIDHEQIVQAENMLLTFRDVRNEVGKGNDIFNQGTKAAVDMSAAFQAAGKSMSISDAALQLGKALNDPIKGMSRLQRIGVTFTDGQKAQVAALEAAGHKQAAQRVILAELNAEFGKSAEAAGHSMPAALNRAKVAAEDLGASIIKKLAPNITTGANKVAHFITQIEDKKGAGGRFRQKVEDIARVVGTVGGKFVHAAEDVGTFFAHHKDLLKIAATMAGVAASVKIISKLGNLTGITGLLRLATGGRRGGILGAVTKAEPLPVYVVNNLPGGGGGGLVNQAEKDAGKVGIGATIKRGLSRAFGFGEDATRIGGAQFLAPAGLLALFGKALGPHKPGIGSWVNPRLDGSGPGMGGAESYSQHQAEAARLALTQQATAAKALHDNAAAAHAEIGHLGSALTGIPDGPFRKLDAAAAGAWQSVKNVRLSTKDLDTVIRGADNGAFGPFSTAIHDSAEKVEHLRDRLSHLKSGSDAYRTTAGELRRAQNTLNGELVAAYRAGRKGAAGIASIGGGASSASDAVAGAAATIAQNVSNLANQLGAQGITFTPAKTPAGRANQAGAFGGLPDFSTLAGGGPLIVGGRPGARGRDDRLLLGPDGRPEAAVGAGELLVFNGDQQHALDSILGLVGLGGLGGFFGMGWRDHAQTPGYAGGGLVPNVAINGPAGGYSRDANAATRTMDRAAEAKIRRLANAPVNRMIRFGKSIAGRHWPYVYGGGHGSFTGPYDCSGFVSAILHAGGLMPGGPMTTDGLKNYGAAGDGGRVTIGVRGSSGRNAHTMIEVGGHYFESGGSGGGAHEMSGWDGNFPIHRHPKGFAGGGIIDVEDLPPSVRELVERNPELLDPRHPAFIGFGLAGGGALNRLLARLPGFKKGGPKPSIKAAKHLAAVAHTHAKNIGAGSLATADTKISKAGDAYGRLERRQGLTDETLIVTDAAGNSHIDKAAQKRAQAEVKARIKAKQAIRDRVARALGAAQLGLDQARAARRNIEQAIARIPTRFANTKAGKKAKAAADALRAKYKGRLQTYDSSISDLKGRIDSLRGQRADLGLDVLELKKEQKGYGDTELEAQLPAPTPATLDSSLTADEHGELDTIGLETAQAGLTPDDTSDDDAAQAHAHTFWQRVLDRLKAAGASTAVLTEATTNLAGTLASSSPTADQAAINAQLQTRLDTANRAAAINAAAVSAFGSPGDVGTGQFGSAYAAARDEGGWTTRSGNPPAQAPAVVQNNYMLHPADPTVLKTIGQAVTAGISYQGSPGSPREAATL